MLFRGNSAAIKIVSAYAKMTGKLNLNLSWIVTGQLYLQRLLSPLIKEVQKLSIAQYEIDPTKIQGRVDLTDNHTRMHILTQKFFDAILGSLDYIPT